MLTLIQPDKFARTTFLFTEAGGRHQRQQGNRYAQTSTKVCLLILASKWLVTIIKVQKKRGFLDITEATCGKKNKQKAEC